MPSDETILSYLHSSPILKSSPILFLFSFLSFLIPLVCVLLFHFAFPNPHPRHSPLSPPSPLSAPPPPTPFHLPPPSPPHLTLLILSPSSSLFSYSSSFSSFPTPPPPSTPPPPHPLTSAIFFASATGCDVTIRSGENEETPQSGILSTPNFPGKYPSRAHCMYTFVARDDQRVHVTFNAFSVDGDMPKYVV